MRIENANRTIAEIGSFEQALAGEVCYWLSKLIARENALLKKKFSGMLSKDEHRDITKLISESTKLTKYDRSPQSPEKLIKLRAMVGDIEDKLVKLR